MDDETHHLVVPLGLHATPHWRRDYRVRRLGGWPAVARSLELRVTEPHKCPERQSPVLGVSSA